MWNIFSATSVPKFEVDIKLNYHPAANQVRSACIAALETKTQEAAFIESDGMMTADLFGTSSIACGDFVLENISVPIVSVSGDNLKVRMNTYHTFSHLNR